ncbi:MAG: DUF1549 domain-containing protein, partial [Verrucomicrobiota bacterium]
CARCHDHKFDPIRQSDYYAMAGIFRSTKTFFGTPPSEYGTFSAPQIKQMSSLMLLPVADPNPFDKSYTASELADMRGEIENLRGQLVGLRRPGGDSTGNGRATSQQMRIRLTNQIYTLSIPGPGEDAAMTGDLDLLNGGGETRICGAGRDLTIIDGGGIDRVISAFPGANIVFRDLTIRGGRAPDGAAATAEGGTGAPGEWGGGIWCNGRVTLESCRLEDNRAGNGGAGWSHFAFVSITPPGNGGAGGEGGGILVMNTGQLDLRDTELSNNRAGAGGVGGFQQNLGSGGNGGVGGDGGGMNSYGMVTIARSLFVDNRAGSGGDAGDGALSSGTGGPGGHGGALRNGFFLTMENSTLSGCAAGRGGAAGTNFVGGTESEPGPGGHGGGFYNEGFAQITHGTVVDNRAGDMGYRGTSPCCFTAPVGNGGGLFNDDAAPFGLARLFVGNSLVGDNTVEATGNGSDCFGTFVSLGYNLLEDTTGCILAGSPVGLQSGVGPGTEPLGNNGGLSRTHALALSSPALNAGDPFFN